MMTQSMLLQAVGFLLLSVSAATNDLIWSWGVSKCNAIHSLQVFPASDAKIFPEYILPLLSMLPDDPEESVRIAYAANIHKIAETANRFMMHSQEIHEIGGLDSPINRAKGSLLERKLTSPKQGVIYFILGRNHCCLDTRQKQYEFF
jgi:hypothetical protein